MTMIILWMRKSLMRTGADVRMLPIARQAASKRTVTRKEF